MAEAVAFNGIQEAPYVSPHDIAYASASLVSIASALYDIAGDNELTEEARNIIRGAVDKWLEELHPIKYYPGLVEELSTIITKNIPGAIRVVGEEFIETLFVESIAIKEAVVSGSIPEEALTALADGYVGHVALLLEALSDKVDWANMPITSSLLWGDIGYERIIAAITIAAISLVLASNK